MVFQSKASRVLLIVWVFCAAPAPAMAYIGPGGGLSAIGAFLAALAAILVAIFGFLWFPIKRLLRGRRRASRQDSEGAQ